jgi:RimJ/RimL family protein N-acetyltransferase
MVSIRPVRVEDAAPLFPLIYRQPEITRWLVWDGPGSRREFEESIAVRSQDTASGAAHVFTICWEEEAVGSIDVRRRSSHRGDLGLWIGLPYHSRGIGTGAIRLAAEYAFRQLGLAKLEAAIFVGNYKSRRAFEKAGFQLEGSIRRAVRKQGEFVDEWLFGLLPEEFDPRR